MKEQIVLDASNGYGALDRLLQNSGAQHILLVCGSSIRFLALDKYFSELPQRTGVQVTRFSGFDPNPDYGSVAEGVRVFQRERCDFVAAVGGGSAMDVAKCIRLFGRMDPDRDLLEQKPVPNPIELLAVPTTAGSGSEATRFAVIYRHGIKLSVTDEQCIPTAVLLDPAVLKPLPELQRKCTMLDALCHSLESFWSVNASLESRSLSKQAIQLLLSGKDSYLHNETAGNAAMQQAAYLAGKAINITQTTAGHAMAYGLTTRYGLPHGQAVAMCVAKLWPFMISNPEPCAVSGGAADLKRIFQALAGIMGCRCAEDAVARYQGLLNELELPSPVAKAEDIPVLVRGVNAERLKNNPVTLDAEAIERLYREILWNTDELR